MKITPDDGTRRFRNKTSIAVEDGALVVTDRKKGVRRFPLNSGPSSPARSLYVSMPYGPSQWAIVDGNGEVLVVGWSSYWDTVEQELLERAAGLPIGIENRGTPMTAEDLRHDGLYLDDGIWWAYAPRAASLALPIGAITQAGWFPAVLGWLIVAALMVFMVVGMTSGAYGKGRRGKGAAARDALMAGDKELSKRLTEEALGESNPPSAEQPKPATEAAADPPV